MTIFLWDMSHFQNPSIGAAVSEGISAITHKAGGDGNDSEIAAWWSGVKGLRPNVLLGAYWVLYPGNPDARADAFLARLDATCPGWRDQPFLLQVDCEEWDNDPATAPPLADIRAFCDRLVGAMPKLRPVVYAPEWHYGNKLAGLGYPLWASSYVTGSGGFQALYPGDGSSKWQVYSGQTPALLQYTDSAVIGGQHPCDASAFRGTLAQLLTLVAPGWETDMPLTSADIQAIAAAVPEAVWKYMLDINVAPTKANPAPSMQPAGSILRYTSHEHGAILNGVGALPTAGQNATATLAALGDAGQTVDQIAAILAPVLGDKAAAVGAALQAAKTA